MEFLRARREKRYALVINDPKPVDDVDDIWASAAQVATIGIFVLLLGAGLYFCRAILLPILAALVVGTTLAPLVKALAKRGVSPWVTSMALVLALVVAVGIAATLLAGPLSEWIGRAPEIGVAIKEKLYVLDRPLTALRELHDISDAVRRNRRGRALATRDRQAGAGGRDARGRAGPAVLRDAGILSARPDRSTRLCRLVLYQPRSQAALHPHCQRHRAQSRVLSRGRDRHQFCSWRGGGDRGMALRFPEPLYPRHPRHGAELHPLYRAGVHDARSCSSSA